MQTEVEHWASLAVSAARLVSMGRPTMTVDFSKAVVHRLKDPGSPGTPRLADELRRWWLNGRRNVRIGRGTLIKRGVSVSMCPEASLVVGENCMVHESVRFLLTRPGPTVTLGRHVNIGFETVIAAKRRIDIGDFSVVAPRVYIIDVEHGFAADDVILNQRSTFEPITIGRDCYIGTGAVITKGVTVGDGSVIGANSVVTRDVGAYEKWAGNPAKPVGFRALPLTASDIADLRRYNQDIGGHAL
jgi:acetyltransferase-like isoleucine patch superfamily enzyme